MRTLHSRGVKGYITFNTLVFDHELRTPPPAIEQIAAAGADALIVQDVGMAQLAHQIAPDRRHSRQHPDEHHQRRGRGAGAALRRQPGGAGA